MTWLTISAILAAAITVGELGVILWMAVGDDVMRLWRGNAFAAARHRAAATSSLADEGRA